MKRNLFGLSLACIVALAAGGCPEMPGIGTPTVSLSIDTTTMGQDGVATVTATLDATSIKPVEVALTFGGTAQSGKDYTRSAMKIVVPPFAKTGSITIRALTNTTFQDDVQVTVAVASVTNGILLADQHTLGVTITNDSKLPEVALSLPKDSDTVSKNGGTLDVAALLSNPSNVDVTVNLSFSGTAVEGQDYTRSDTKIVVEAGKSVGTITLTGVAQEAYVNGKTIIIGIDSVTNATKTTAASGQEVTAYISDDGEAPIATLTLDKTTISAAGGVATLSCTLDRAIGADATVEFTVSGTAKYDKNYSVSDLTLTVPAGQTTGSITITGKERSQYVGDVTLELGADKITNMTPSQDSEGTFTITIQDTHAAPRISLSIAGSPMAESSKGTATVTVTQSAATAATTTVVLGLAGTATKDTDYTTSGTTVTIEPGKLSAVMTLTAISDAIFEGDETIIITISSVTNAVQEGTQQVTAFVSDAQAQPTVSLRFSSDLLYHTSGLIQLNARLSIATSQEVTVNLEFAGTAIKDTDYTVADTRIVIPAGNVEGSMVVRSVSTSGDRLGKTIIATLGAITNATAGSPNQTTATFSDVSVSLAMAGSPVVEAGGVATLTATLSKAVQVPATIQLAFSGTATKDTDYTASDTKIVIPAGQTIGTLTLTAKDDSLAESNETIIVNTQQVQGASLAGTSQFTVTITDNFNQKTKAAGEAFLADNATKPGVTVTASGLQYKIITAGTGAKPTASDTVSVKYTGTLIDGTVFDSSNGQAVTFPLGNLIKGWIEALQLMPVGSHWTLYIPYDLAYGAAGSPPKIPPYSALIFDIELVGIAGQ